MRLVGSSMPGKGEKNPISIMSAVYPPLKVGWLPETPRNKIGRLGVSWGDSELLPVRAVKKCLFWSVVTIVFFKYNSSFLDYSVGPSARHGHG